MTKTILITGTSSGIGRETAKLFLAKGWNVIATMRNPKAEHELTLFKNALVLPCDVTDPQSIKKAVEDGVKQFGRLDVLVNNAGYYTLGPLEAASPEQVRKLIDTNLIGLIAVTGEVIPYFRNQKSGMIVNLSSIAGVISIPLQSLYHATKWGVEGFSESLQYELEPFNIRVKLIEPGVIKTDFYGRSMTLLHKNDLSEYEEYSGKVIKNIQANGEHGSDPKGVAQTIYKAATDHKKKLRYLTGNSKHIASLRTFLPQSLFRPLIKGIMER